MMGARTVVGWAAKPNTNGVAIRHRLRVIKVGCVGLCSPTYGGFAKWGTSGISTNRRMGATHHKRRCRGDGLHPSYVC